MEATVSQKLEILLKLQALDSKLDEIVKMRGDLPEEIRDLEDELVGFETRIKKFETEIEGFNEEISNRKNASKESEKLIKKYLDQQSNVRNNREYDAISKEIELQQLDIQLSEKKIKEANLKIESRNLEIETIKNSLADREKDLANKKSELEILVSESLEEETKIQKDREKVQKQLEERLYQSYNRLRHNLKNGLAVVVVKRDACGGCFNTVPPQRQADIKEKKKIIVCEHCGRIFADVESVLVAETSKK
jgi:predicted  nucleic acid-binding Zn-ribbon protein